MSNPQQIGNVPVVANSAMAQTNQKRNKKYSRRNRYRSILSHRPNSVKGTSMKIWWRVKYDIPSVEYTLLYKKMFNTVENVLFDMGFHKDDILSVTKTGYLWLDLISGILFYNKILAKLPKEKYEISFLTH